MMALSLSLSASKVIMAQNAPIDVLPKPKVYAVADAHLDTQWNWDIQTTIKDYVWNTLNQNLTLLKRYPQYVFNFEGGVKYAWMKEYYPREYELMKQYIHEGRWHIAGSSWDATDVLIPSPESAIRNILFGQTYYRQEFGVESTDIFLPDCFGFGWTLPTIASHCGLIGFSSQKLDWRMKPFYGDSKHPFTLGLWKGIDGSEIMLAHGYSYNKQWKETDLSYDKELQEYAARSPLNKVYRYYGTGDIGGSPTLQSVRSVMKGMQGDGPLEIVSATSDQVFKEYLPFDKHPQLPVYSGELLMDVHGTGCYTSQAAMKLYNRQNEQLGDAAERAALTNEWLNGAAYPKEVLNTAWKRFIFHQFHDDLTGTSLPRAYEFSWNDELISLSQFADVVTSSVEGIASRLDTRTKGVPVVLYNALAFTSTQIVEVEVSSDSAPQDVRVYDENGDEVASQLLGWNNGKAKVLIEATLPSVGYAVYDVRPLKGKKKAGRCNQNTNILENSAYKIRLDANGDIVSLREKKENREWVKPGERIRLALFTDNKSDEWPAWEIHKKVIDKAPRSIGEGKAKITLVEDGTLRKTVRVQKQYGTSTFSHDIHLYGGSMADRIDFHHTIDWETNGALLKAEFPMNISDDEATYDLGLGCINRGNNTDTAYEVYAQDWADLTDQSNTHGVSILTDSKYGWDKPDNHTLRLTLLHTPEVKGYYKYQNYQDYGHHDFTYSLFLHKGGLDYMVTRRHADGLNQPFKAFEATRHKGDLGRCFSMLECDNPNVVVKAFKKAETSDDYVIRVYEQGGKSVQKANISFAAPIVEACSTDGTEKKLCDARFEGNRLAVTVKPFSLATYRLKLRPQSADDIPCPPVQQVLQLPFNCRSASWNSFRQEGNFESGYSYAAELWPDSLSYNQMGFKLAKNDSLNGYICSGDTLVLPLESARNTNRRLYFLAASTQGDQRMELDFGKLTDSLFVPYYTGFIGQWGHHDSSHSYHHTNGYLKPAEVAYVGTHRHVFNEDLPYEFTYMFKVGVDVPKGVTSLVLPTNRNVVLFAATLSINEQSRVRRASELFRTANKEEGTGAAKTLTLKNNLLEKAILESFSGCVNEHEHPRFLVDGNLSTKWCDVSAAPNYVDYDLGEVKSIAHWKLVNAGIENRDWITGDCYLQVKETKDEVWRTVDNLRANRQDKVTRTLLKPIEARFVRLLITRPIQTADGNTTRIYEFGVYE